MAKLRYLSRDDVKKALPMRDAIDAMKSAFVQNSIGQAEMPLRARVPALNNGVSLIMPAFLKESAALGVKIVSVFPENAPKNLPIIHAMIMALDAETGQILAIMEGGSLTAIRTGAGSGAATDVLARKDASTVAIVGSGVQARSQLEAVCTVRKIERVYVFSTTRKNAELFVQDMAGQGEIPKEIIVTNTANEAVRAADIICAATTSSIPVFDGNLVKAGTHINGVGSYLPTMQELDEVTLQRALITVDSRESVLAEAGEIIIAMQNGSIGQDAIHAEIGEIIAGQKQGRSSNEQITFFKSCGIAVQDTAAAHVALKNAIVLNIGTVLEA